MKTLLPLLALLLPALLAAQITITGNVYDKKTGQPIPYVSIGVVGKLVGTLSDVNGNFALKINENQKQDTIKFYAIGYKDLVFKAADLVASPPTKLLLEELPEQLDEVVVKAKRLHFKRLGTTHYTTENCTGFATMDGNWKGSEAAILIRNKKHLVIENFHFYIIQNTYEDSVLFRLTFYSRIPGRKGNKVDEKEDWVGPTFLKKPIYFKTAAKNGEITVPLDSYNIQTSGDFFVSLECLLDEMDIARFCYAGSAYVPSFFKVKVFSTWRKTPGGGADFNVGVSYVD